MKQHACKTVTKKPVDSIHASQDGRVDTWCLKYGWKCPSILSLFMVEAHIHTSQKSFLEEQLFANKEMTVMFMHQTKAKVLHLHRCDMSRCISRLWPLEISLSSGVLNISTILLSCSQQQHLDLNSSLGIVANVVSGSVKYLSLMCNSCTKTSHPTVAHTIWSMKMQKLQFRQLLLKNILSHCPGPIWLITRENCNLDTRCSILSCHTAHNLFGHLPVDSQCFQTM